MLYFTNAVQLFTPPNDTLTATYPHKEPAPEIIEDSLLSSDHELSARTKLHDSFTRAQMPQNERTTARQFSG